MTEALRYEDVSFTYPEADRPALQNVTVQLSEGTFALATGPTGSGKSTFLRAANGLVPHFTGGTFAGRVFAEDRNTLEHAPRRLADIVAFVPQDPSSSFVLDRVEDELAYGMENLEVAPDRMRRRVEEMLDLLAIERLRSRSVRTLSGGERQRVAIAAALAAGPRILVLDEPTSQLDPQGAEDVLAALQRLVHDLGMTVLLAEHRLERVAGFADVAFGFPGDASVISGSTADVVTALGAGPPVARVGRLLRWSSAPLTVRDARALACESELPTVAPHVTHPAKGQELLTAVGMSAGYEGVDVLTGIDLSLAEGEIVALLGRNGSGKTTLLRSLCGVHEPYAGHVTTRAGAAPRPGIDVALCPQDPESVLFKDTVADEVRATIEARHATTTPAEILAMVGIADLAHRHPRDLSAGQRLLVATAAIIAAGAPVLLLDEPTRGLDPASKERLAAFLRIYTAKGRAVVFATHDVELAAAVATRTVMLAAGEIIGDGDPAAVLGDSHVFAPQMTRVFGTGWLTPEQVAGAAG